LSNITNVMKSKGITILPKLEKILFELGENIKLARLRRKLTADQISERAGINRTTLWSIEKGSPNVTMAGYIQVLFVLGLEKDLLDVAQDDEFGRKLQDTELIIRKRAPKKK
jgi:transcriptional regulator with XRE-family HTH domain